MKRYAFLPVHMIFLLVVVNSAQGAFVPLDYTAVQKPQMHVMSAHEQGVILNLSVSGFDVRDIDTRQITDTGTEVFSLLSLGEFTHTTELGKPKMPVVTGVLDVPYQAQISVEVISAHYEEIDLEARGIKRIMPALASVPKVPGARARFVIDESCYKTQAFYPDRIVEVEENNGFARGHRLATIRFFPIHYNPAAHSIQVYRTITVRVNFTGGNVAQTKQSILKNHSSAWEDFIRSIVLNYPAYLRDVPQLPVYYDIFYNSAFATAVDSLAFWKMKKGYTVRMWDASGWTAQAIDDTIEAQTPLATYLVIVGDPNSPTPLPAWGNGNSTGDQTDLYYAEIDDAGFLPDMFSARISVLDSEQAYTVVQKALRYEHASFGSAGTDWLQRAFLIAGYDTDYQPVGIATNAYCRDLLLAHGYTVDTIIGASGEEQTRVVDAINNGYVWCVYTGHGSIGSWFIGGYTGFSYSELIQLTHNLDMYPMPSGHCCLTGDYQNYYNCFGETWDRISGKGGIGSFCSVPGTFWDEDDWLQRRYFDALYADSIPGNLYETGRFTQWGLYWINNNTGTTAKQYYFEAYHLFNDPSLDFWTDIPDTLCVSHADSVSSPSSFSITVQDKDGTPLRNALVCCWIHTQSPQLHAVGYTDSTGTVSLDVIAQNVNDTMWVTATKHNYVPYEGYAIVSFVGIADNTSGALHTKPVLEIYPTISRTRSIDFYIQGMTATPSTLRIYNSAGRLVREFGNPAPHIMWDRTDTNGNTVSSGIYFIKFEQDTYKVSKKIILVK